jgi:hypothetical protein
MPTRLAMDHDSRAYRAVASRSSQPGILSSVSGCVLTSATGRRKGGTLGPTTSHASVVARCRLGVLESADSQHHAQQSHDPGRDGLEPAVPAPDRSPSVVPPGQ